MSRRSERSTRALAFAGRQVLRLLWASYRRPDAQRLATILGDVDRPTILLAWHDEAFLVAGYLRTLTRDHQLGIMASLSGDGDLVTRVPEPLVPTASPSVGSIGCSLVTTVSSTVSYTVR